MEAPDFAYSVVKSTTVKEMYKMSPTIPPGTEIVGFRPVEDGELYLSLVDAHRGGRTLSQKSTGISVEGPRLILKRVKIEETVESNYGVPPNVPDGYFIVAFRVPEKGDLYLPIEKFPTNMVVDFVTGDAMFKEHQKRLIVKKVLKPKPEKIVRVVRVLEYVGPEKWVDSTFSANAVGPEGPRIVRNGKVVSDWRLAEGKQIRELSTFKEEVICPK